MPAPSPARPTNLPPRTRLLQLNAFQQVVATTQAETSASCPAEEVLGDAAVTAQDKKDSDATVELVCKAPGGGRTNNRQLMPRNGRPVLVSQA